MIGCFRAPTASRDLAIPRPADALDRKLHQSEEWPQGETPGTELHQALYDEHLAGEVFFHSSPRGVVGWCC
jgi:hypothetical protein